LAGSSKIQRFKKVLIKGFARYENVYIQYGMLHLIKELQGNPEPFLIR
jgi:hypothetical protein